ncbi:Phosphate regulon transcriptional regulatory protein PhoB (SphR) [Thioalkalivibrio nitratireducens DSM 14787]|uniref:Phosphate regulon transcriptional regulatory protein PhoB n=1 Tax=Thioalkalivibrio nitratireducens (strain DSM 14787 / UNIQEM 213 / ALEN2) TaxID=1255043 RepID=L0DW54_THIND|nr:phosphate regulon transcriptional regulator PhoB [Thioalkalivibrio nitratireducens]AGA32581.1 Phosphate regulon transcriptional regulatory protein PhoB (SphR) [Thioalkalivibrio nitratireducens DSM 14787]
MALDILLVEDDAAVREVLAVPLQKAGFNVIEAADVREARAALLQQLPDLILLDWMLPDVSGVEWARSLKSAPHTRNIPIIMLTARGEEEDRVKGLEVGADDYVTKPFSPRELIARIRAVLRRTTPTSSDEPVEVDGLRLDPVSHRVTAHGANVEVGPTEYRLLHFFMTHQDRVFTRGQLLDNVWGTNVYVEERTVDVHIRRLRIALSGSGHDALVQTIRGAGYRFSRQP